MALVFDFWVCEGRVCADAGADGLRDRLEQVGDENAHDVDGEKKSEGNDAPKVRVLRGGCFGCCNTAPNVVVRRHEVEGGGQALPNTLQDRLSLTLKSNEFVYGEVNAANLSSIVDAHLLHDEEDEPLLRKKRKPLSVAERVERIRRQKQD
ncbi:MAG: (2Fe-2S) ferredoxin domain-containing protein [Deltaproteobacteria bacterium]|nr:(2Fe-2S) ferredoxin domain-containing protein [Deltaproteobacteria bacterium]